MSYFETDMRRSDGQEKSYAGGGGKHETIAPIRRGTRISSVQSLHTTRLPWLLEHQVVPREVEFNILYPSAIKRASRVLKEGHARAAAYASSRIHYVVLAYFGGQTRPWTYGAISSAGCCSSVWPCTTFAYWTFTPRSATKWSSPCCFCAFR